MQLNQFIKQNRTQWQHLEALTKKIQKKPTQSTIDDFENTYRKVSQQLSYSQTYFPNDEITLYLNEIVSRAHNVLYQSQLSSWKQIHYFFSTKFVGLLLEQWKAIVIAMLLFVLGGVASFFAVINDPINVYGILPAELAQNLEAEKLGTVPKEVNASLMSAEIMTNNIQVAILAFAGGITFGILTVYILIYNGMIIGALAALFWHAENSYAFWAFIVPHGMIELLAIFIAGGAGLLMGYKLFVPKERSRVSHLKIQTVRSVQLLLGTIPLFIIAGLIEGFITPADLSLELKYVVAFITVIGVILYMLIGHYLLKKRSRLSETASV
ncbi:stage II sporulation protein M [Saliterribacillus persicus]|uniref:Putative membrane protein SpoIIM required for sporulation n=1 Tax=Saliterribacillus persicus TaxID=930114 RepID=A0A368XYU8_9BACI|nr:stage II sporulation protein M [Saliterribacillus persicus]RCW73152.1 putative membrane protein SpoIIM required for sporulation [Saliterribacillus persicus]